MNTAVVAQPIVRQTLDIGLVFKQGWRLFVKDIGPLIIGALIVGLLSIVTLGILAGPLRRRPLRDGRQARERRAAARASATCSARWTASGPSSPRPSCSSAHRPGLAHDHRRHPAGHHLAVRVPAHGRPRHGPRRGDAAPASRWSEKSGFWEHLALVIVFVVIASIANGALGDPGHTVLRRRGRRRLLPRGGQGRRAGARGRLTRRADRRAVPDTEPGGGGLAASPALRRPGPRPGADQPAARSRLTPRRSSAAA